MPNGPRGTPCPSRFPRERHVRILLAGAVEDRLRNLQVFVIEFAEAKERRTEAQDPGARGLEAGDQGLGAAIGEPAEDSGLDRATVLRRKVYVRLLRLRDVFAVESPAVR